MRARVCGMAKWPEQPTEESTSSVCVATVDDSTSSEECEESVECEPVASILSSSQVVCTEQETQGPESVIVVAVPVAKCLPRAQSCK